MITGRSTIKRLSALSDDRSPTGNSSQRQAATYTAKSVSADANKTDDKLTGTAQTARSQPRYQP